MNELRYMQFQTYWYKLKLRKVIRNDSRWVDLLKRIPYTSEINKGGGHTI